jgi:DNA polymerase-3 subunit delta'
MNWNLIGHEWAVQLFQGHLSNNSLRHAYLITGPKDIGKQILAIRFIQAILCEQSDLRDRPCLKCITCQRVDRQEHPDLFPVGVSEGSSLIKVDQVRELMHRLSLSPYEATHKIGLILEIENASVNTQNALLKTLEEPPSPVILILTATSVDQVIETILSRCEEIKLNSVPIPVTQQGLESLHQVPKEKAELLAHISGGKPVKALKYFLDPSILEQRTSLLDEHHEILLGGSVERFAYAAKISSDPLMVQEMLDTWYSIWHDILIKITESEATIQNMDRQEDIEKVVKNINPKTVKNTLASLKRAEELIRMNANLKLTVENLLLQLPSLNK